MLWLLSDFKQYFVCYVKNMTYIIIMCSCQQRPEHTSDLKLISHYHCTYYLLAVKLSNLFKVRAPSAELVAQTSSEADGLENDILIFIHEQSGLKNLYTSLSVLQKNRG